MSDDKRLLRQLKRSIKQSGNRKRRRFLKDVSADPDGFDLGDDSSAFMNERGQRHSASDTAPTTTSIATTMKRSSWRERVASVRRHRFVAPNEPADRVARLVRDDVISASHRVSHQRVTSFEI
jgi:hypothetical protein